MNHLPLLSALKHLAMKVEELEGGDCADVDSEALLAAAFDFAFQLHEGQFRASGDPYIVHPVAVADLLRDIGASAPVIAAGFLHDVVEDTDITAEQLEGHFGPEVRALVEGVTKLGGLHVTDDNWRSACAAALDVMPALSPRLEQWRAG